MSVHPTFMRSFAAVLIADARDLRRVVTSSGRTAVDAMNVLSFRVLLEDEKGRRIFE